MGKYKRQALFRNMNTNKTAHFDLVDILRAFAALTVVVYHTIIICGWQDFPTTYPLAWFRYGWMGVDIFFVISGFVITWSALNMQEKSGGKNIFFSFMKNRLRRIVPLHYLTMALFILLFPAIVYPDFLYDLLAHVFFVHNWFPEYHGTINGINWSLGAEMQFYVLLALTVGFLNFRTLKIFIFGALAITFLWRLYTVVSLPVGSENFAMLRFICATELPGMLDLFAAGIGLAFFARTPMFGRLAGSTIGKATVFLAFCAIMSVALWIFERRMDYSKFDRMVIFFRTILALAFGLLLLFFCLIKPGPRIKLFLSPLLYLGTISYGIYLFHLPVVLKTKDLDMAPGWKLALILIITISLAALSWHFYEKRFLIKYRRKN